MSAPLTGNELARLREWVETCRDPWWILPRIASLLDEVEEHRTRESRVAPGDRYPGGDEHTERCRGLRCPCWLEGRGENRGEPVCDGSGRLAGNGVPPMGLSADWGECPGCSACHKNGGGGEGEGGSREAPGVDRATVTSTASAAGDGSGSRSPDPLTSPAAVREAAGTVTERAAEAVALALYGEGSWPPNAATGHTLVAEVEAVADALAAAGLLRPEPWTTHDGEGRRWQVDVGEGTLLASAHEQRIILGATVRPLPTEEATDGE